MFRFAEREVSFGREAYFVREVCLRQDSGTLYFTAPKELLHYADGITSLGEAKHHFLFTAKLPEAHIFGSFTVIRCFRGLPFV